MKKIVTLTLAVSLLTSLTACGSAANAADTDYIYGQIDTVSGNDIVLLLADYHEETDENSGSESEDSAAEQDSKRERPSGFSKPENGEMPDGFDSSNFSGEKPEGFSRPKSDDTDTESDGETSERKKPSGFSKPENGEMPEDFDPSNFSGGKPEGFSKPENGEIPEGFDPFNFSGGKPEGFSKPEDGEMPEGFDSSKFSRRQSGSSRYTLTGEQEELRIPVGTTVTTALGVETDFEVLKSGDLIKCSIAKDSDGNDVITAVWIMEQ